MSTRILLITLFLILGKHLLLSQTLMGYDGELWYFYPGYTYTIQPIPSSDTSVSPRPLGSEWAEPMTFILKANAGDQFQINFLVTDDFSECEPALISTLSTDGLRRADTNARLNPNIPQIFTAPSSGETSFNLGIMVTIPADARRNFFSAIVTCIAVNTQTGDSLSANATFFIGPGGLLSYGGESYINALSKGFTYSFIPGSENKVIPRINGNESATSTRFQSDALKGRLIGLTFNLPTHLVGDREDTIPCSFASDALYIEETNERFDPHSLVVTRITSSCSITFDLGITITIPENVASETYLGMVLVSASYIGNFKNKQSTASYGESSILYLVEINPKEIPQNFSLSQNYPNPFNSGTKIRYGLPDPANVNITIFDVLGRQVATLVDEFKYAGWHTVVWQADDFPSGVYFCKLTSSNLTQTKKLLLIR